MKHLEGSLLPLISVPLQLSPHLELADALLLFAAMPFIHLNGFSHHRCHLCNLVHVHLQLLRYNI